MLSARFALSYTDLREEERGGYWQVGAGRLGWQ